MAYVMKENLANRANYGSKRSLSKIKYIVVHYTGNDGDTDENNGNYFKNNVVYASAHYFVDDDSVTRCVPDNYVAYSVGGSRYSNYKTTGGAKLYGKATNENTLNIELCDDVKNGTVYPSVGVIANGIALVKAKQKQYNIPDDRVIRHFDVTGKSCPSYWCGTSKKNKLWLTEFHNKLSTSTSTSGGTSSKKPTVSKEIEILSRAYVDKWYGNVSSFTKKGTESYIGVKGYPLHAIQANTVGERKNVGRLKYRLGVLDGGYLNFQYDREMDENNENFAGDLKSDFDRLQMILEDCPGYQVEYQAMVGGKWLDWVRGYNNENTDGYAGIKGKPIECVRMRIVKVG